VSPLDCVARRTGKGYQRGVTDESNNFEHHLQKKRKNCVAEVMVLPFGCVFGMRNDSGAWSFTLQRNASVSYLRVFKEGSGLFGKKVKKGPDNNNPTLKFYTAVNLGFTDFFPQPGSTHYHALRTIQIY
jgi:hypothetical protein